ncbi:hypothetical protein QAD02_015804 [Eretmocerus hayati]|uniref:Uncharacterized protein n=1 Tax=Eretmocerus hayati TaxID=131215 RepID=A0ACC2P9N4_9HYME|nr:hypothetical protein QAD02_015804 [Eretmocerus hayati]
MSTPCFAEDSNVFTLAPILSQIVEKLDDSADKYDYLMVFIICLMAESGYRVSCLYNEGNEAWSNDLTSIPHDWKYLAQESPQKYGYQIRFLLHKCREIACKLIGIPVGDWMVLNLLPARAGSRCATRCISVNVAKYVNMHQKELQKFWHLKELSLMYKNNLLAPLHGEMLMEIGVASPSLQGLPAEIKATISKKLDPKSRKNLEEIWKTAR